MSFNVTSAASTGYLRMSITFNAPPNVVEAGTLTNYSVPGLTLSGTPTLVGNTVNLTTSAQSVTSYTVTVSNVTRAGDTEPLTTNTAGFTGSPPFNVTLAEPIGGHKLSVTFDAPPNAAQATALGSYSVPGLALSGTPFLVGDAVTLVTGAQVDANYSLTVSNVTRASDADPLVINTASFVGRSTFNVASVVSASATQVAITFDAQPNAIQATTLANYSIPGLVLSGTPLLIGYTVTLTTSVQSSMSYTARVSDVTRASDGEPLTTKTALFSGWATFDIDLVTSTSNSTIVVTFSATPNATQATTLANYSIPGLVLSITPLLVNSTVTITTSAQSTTNYTLTVSNVTRATDSEPLTTNAVSFTGHAAFNVVSAAATANNRLVVSFDAPPSGGYHLSSYSVPGLTLIGPEFPQVTGNSITLITSEQTAISYTVTASNVTRASDGEPLITSTASFMGNTGFNVAAATSTGHLKMVNFFDASPNAVQATTILNYNVPGLVIGGTPTLTGSQVNLETSAQAATVYTVAVSNVTRDSDAAPLGTSMASFTGRSEFNVVSVVSISNTKISVTFDAPPDEWAARQAGYYSVPGLKLTYPSLSGNTVTLTTSAQSAISYLMTVSAAVIRESDGEPPIVRQVSFTGIS
jgi:hypothetical protein